MTKQERSSKTNDIIIVLPGDNVTKYITNRNNDDADENDTTSSAVTPTSNSKKGLIQPKLGTGIRYDVTTNQFYATCSGRLEQRRTNPSVIIYYIQPNIAKRYRPVVEDRIIGIIEEHAGTDGVGGDLYRVNIQASHPAILSNLSFEGATKRNKPSFQPGQIIYARVVPSVAATEQQQQQNHANKKFYMSPDVLYDPITLSCTNGPHDGSISRKDWMTSEGAYGELRGGTICTIPLVLARELLQPSSVVLEALSSYRTIQFEIAIGVNGILWIHSPRPEYTILIQNAIQNSAVMTPEQVRSMVKNLVYNVEKRLQQQRDAADSSEA